MQINPDDNVLVALTDLKAGEEIAFNSHHIRLEADIPQKHKFTTHALQQGDEVHMYGVLVGKATEAIPEGALSP